MPNNIPPIDTIDLLEDKILMAKKKACIDFGLYAEINSKNIDQIPLLAERCTAFKLYLPNVQDLSNISRKLPEHKVIAIHAEDGKCVEKYKKMEKSLADHSNSRPTECEVEAIKKMMRVGKDKKDRLHICHLSSAQGLATLKKYKNEKVSVGVTPHHLLLSIDSNFRLQSFGKVNPPLREKKDNHSLFEGIMNGTIDIIESDHAPHSIEEKEKKFDDAPSGIPGVETSLPLFLSLVKKRRIPLSRLVNLFCERPAEIFKIKKGKISIGNDADLIIIKLEEKKIKSEELHSKCGWSPFEGMDAIFPTNAFLRGERIIEDGEFVGEKGYGKFIGE
jgi:dihydroorotase